MNKTERLRIGVPVTADFPTTNYFNALNGLGADGYVIDQFADPSDYNGLLIPGGYDIDPARYGQVNHACEKVNPSLDELQFETLRKFVEAGKPVLGICRGHQLINVFFGGSLHQHIGESGIHDWDPDTHEDKAHGVRSSKDSWIADLYGECFTVNSAHHQAVDHLGDTLVIDQYSEDGIVEAIHCTRKPVYGVQWHPERMCFANRRSDTVDGSIVIGYFLKLCTETVR